MASAAFGQSAPATGVPAPAPSPAVALYDQLRDLGLDPSHVYTVRDFDFDREQLHVTLDSGTIALTTAVDGRITGAFFEGDGEVLLMPPSDPERISLTFFTGAAILEDRFRTAYFRFSDDFLKALQPHLRPADDPNGFVAEWDSSARALAASDALRMLAMALNAPHPAPRFLHVRIGSMHFGPYDLFYDATSSERIAAVQPRVTAEGVFLDNWTSFSGPGSTPADPRPAPWSISDYDIHARVTPPRDLDVQVSFTLQPSDPGQRVAAMELSRYLQVSSATADGKPLEFIQNPALEGSQLSRRGNDLLALVFDHPLNPGQKVRIELHYAGPVLSDAGGGLMYVGARGTWYPTRGLVFSRYQLDFEFPEGWTLVATGKLISDDQRDGEHHVHYVSDGPIPVAGFNLGQYVATPAKAGNVEVKVYAARAFENDLHVVVPRGPGPEASVGVLPPIPGANPPYGQAMAGPPASQESPQPTENAELVAKEGVRALTWYEQVFGPYPFSALAFTQMPGRDSQGWPGVIFLSSYAFLPPEVRVHTPDTEFENLLFDSLLAAHETAHQWWGDSVLWRTYHDQWMMEALANYSALMMLERQHPEVMHQALDHYRKELLRENREGAPLASAGPVTLGVRLSSSRFPDGYDSIAYGRGTWLIHMLREMLRDPHAATPEAADALFLSTLRKLLEEHKGGSIATSDLQQAFEKVLPANLWFEHSRSLDWFFQGWVNGIAIPRYVLSDVKISKRDGKMTASGRLLQKDAPSTLVASVPIYAQISGVHDPVLVTRIFADGTETSFRISVPTGTRKLLADPYGTILSRP